MYLLAQTRRDAKRRSSRKYRHSLTNVIYKITNTTLLLGGYKIEQQEDGALKQVPYKPGDEKEVDEVPQMSLVTYSKAFQVQKQDEREQKAKMETQLSYKNNQNTSIPVQDNEVPLSFAPGSFA